MPNRDKKEEGSIMNPDSSDGIYSTELVESECGFIAQNLNMKEEDNIKMIKANALKRDAHMNQRGKSFTKLVEVTSKIPNNIVASEDPSTPLPQVPFSF